MRGLWPGLLVLLLAAACSADDPAAPEIERPEDIVLEIVVDEVPGPTQVFVEPDGSLVAAAINGGENDGNGQVLRFDLESGERTVLFDRLDKPTGVQRDGETIYVMETDRLSAGPAEGGSLIVVADELPNNGRSEGTISLHPDGGILFNTSGSARGVDVVEGSGQILAYDPGDAEAGSPDGPAPTVVAEGFKHAYAVTFADTGREDTGTEDDGPEDDGGRQLWATEVSDGTFDDVPPMDEVVVVTPPLPGGWPRCVGDNRAVMEFGVDQSECDQLQPSRAVFTAGATPTSIVVSPFHDDAFLVALWVTGEIVVVPRLGDDPTDWTVFASGLANPQHLAVDGDAVYVTEHGADRILKLTRQ